MASSHHEAAAEDMKGLRDSYTNLATNHQQLKKDHQKLIGKPMGAFINDVTHIWILFDPSPPLSHSYCYNLVAGFRVYWFIQH